MSKETVYVKKIALLAIFSALGVALSPFWFEAFGTKAFPAQHMVNAILGVLLGPLWSVVAAVFIGTIRNTLGLGTVYAFPGGIPGGIVVGLVYWILKRLKLSEKSRLVAALSESLGTLLIGAPLAFFLVAPWISPQLSYSQQLLNLMTAEGYIFGFLIFAFWWALSCVPGSIMGFIILLILKKIGISRETLFGEK